MKLNREDVCIQGEYSVVFSSFVPRISHWESSFSGKLPGGEYFIASSGGSDPVSAFDNLTKHIQESFGEEVEWV